ncbi:hypothetical protein ACI1MP_37330 (plasmid) [Kitasatospora griseola]|uniref:hypothetical protein n=1 Tax=Kitasatospora griseola TaxID=2064 RepID=UPI003855B7FC
MRAWHKPETETETFARCLGHYAAAVAEALIADGLSVRVGSVSGPCMVWEDSKDVDGPDVEVFQDAKVHLYFGREFRKHVGSGKGCELIWAADSGWYFFIDDANVKYAEAMAAARWMGAGLVPEPKRVVQFVSALRLDLGASGSTERPYYRTAGENPEAVVSRLEPYVPKRFHGQLVTGQMPWEYRHSWHRNRLVSGQVVSTMTDEPNEPWVDVPMRASEVRALLRLIQVLEMTADFPSTLTTLSHSLVEDLHSRLAAQEEPEQHQRGLLEAFRLKKHFEKYPLTD